MITLRDAQREIISGMEKGTTCPCCGQFVKLYRRKITSSMAYVLILMYNKKVSYFFNVPAYLNELKVVNSLHANFPLLRFWGLIEKRGNIKKDGNPNSGLYRITDKGVNFVHGNTTAKKYIYLYNNKVKKLSTQEVTIQQALTQKFDYHELMYGQTKLF